MPDAETTDAETTVAPPPHIERVVLGGRERIFLFRSDGSSWWLDDDDGLRWRPLPFEGWEGLRCGLPGCVARAMRAGKPEMKP